jgi:hypothetical protein
MASVTVDASRAADLGQRDPVPACTTRPAAADRSAVAARPGRTVRSWPLLVLAAPAAAEVWSGWVGIAQKTGFGLVRPLPGIWSSLHLDTAITLPIGVETYAAYALRAWLTREQAISARTRRFAKWSAICSFALGMAGQVAYHLMAQAEMTRAPWAITTIVSCLPVLVLGMGTALAHMLRADAEAINAPDSGTNHQPPCGPCPGPLGTRTDQAAGTRRGTGTCPPSRDQVSATTGPQRGRGSTGAGFRAARPQVDQARLVARRLAAAGKPVSRRALRCGGVRGSNEALNALARMLNSELAGAAPPGAPAG